jgi:hypothetical protein
MFSKNILIFFYFSYTNDPSLSLPESIVAAQRYKNAWRPQNDIRTLLITHMSLRLFDHIVDRSVAAAAGKLSY